MSKRTLWIVMFIAGCAQQPAPAPTTTDVVDPWKQYQVVAPATVMQDGTSCPPNYVVNPNNANDCVPAPGMVPVGIPQPDPVAQSVDAQTRVMREMAETQRGMRNDAREAAVQAQRAAAEDRLRQGN